MPKQSNGKKYKSPSVERQLALSLVWLIECLGLVKIDPAEEGFDELDRAAKDGLARLEAAGYGGLQSTQSRVRKIEADIAEAVRARDGAKLAILGAALDRAKAGKPPLATEKKTRKPRAKKETPADTAPKERKPRKKKDEGTNDLVLSSDGKLESLTEPAIEDYDVDGDPAWLTHHPEPK